MEIEKEIRKIEKEIKKIEKERDEKINNYLDLIDKYQSVIIPKIDIYGKEFKKEWKKYIKNDLKDIIILNEKLSKLNNSLYRNLSILDKKNNKLKNNKKCTIMSPK